MKFLLMSVLILMTAGAFAGQDGEGRDCDKRRLDYDETVFSYCFQNIGDASYCMDTAREYAQSYTEDYEGCDQEK